MRLGYHCRTWLGISLLLTGASSAQPLGAGDLLIADAGNSRILLYDASADSLAEIFSSSSLASANGGTDPLVAGEILYDNHQAFLYFSGTGGSKRLYRADPGTGLIQLADNDLLTSVRGLPDTATIDLTGKAIPTGGVLLYADRSNGGALIGLELRTGIHTEYASASDFITFSASSGAGMTALEFVSLAYDSTAGDYLVLAGGASLDGSSNPRPALYRAGANGQPTYEYPLGDANTGWHQVLPAPGGAAYIIQSSANGTSLLLLETTGSTVLLAPADTTTLFGASTDLALASDSSGHLLLMAPDGTVVRVDPDAANVAASATELISAQDYTNATGTPASNATGVAHVAAAPVSYTVTESSNPDHLISETTTQVIENRYHTVNTPNIVSGNWRLGFWSINGVRASTANGRGLLRPIVQVTEDLDLVAQYYEIGLDGDGDRLEDWWEFWMFGDRTRGPQDNDDGDAFGHEDEFTYGYDATVTDTNRPGGVAARASAKVAFLKQNGFRYHLTSEPIGLIEQVRNILPDGSTITTPYLNGETNGHMFVGWEVDGVRVSSPSGVYLNEISLQPTGDVEVVARFILTGQDSDGDQLPDYYEMQNFGNLSQSGSSDPDSDGVTILDELALGYSPVLSDNLRSGGVAARSSATITYADGKSLYTVESIPFGLVNSVSEWVDNGVSRTTDHYGFSSYSGMEFGYWSVNGQRIADPSGVARGEITTVVNGTTEVRAHFFLPNVDSDADGIEDYIEWRHYGSLDADRLSDIDGDGINLGDEIDYGMSLTVDDDPRSGGIAARVSRTIVFNASTRKRYHFETSPLGLADSETSYLEQGTAVSTPVYNFDSEYTGYRFTHFSINGQRVANEAGMSRRQAQFNLDQDSTVIAHFVLDGSDSDEDGIWDDSELRQTDSLADFNANSDPDNDGLSMSEEQDWGTSGSTVDILRSGGIAARNSYVRSVTLDVGPSGLGLTNSTIESGSPIGTLVGHLVTSGGNPDDTFNYSMVAGSGDTANGSFSISGNQLLSAATFPSEADLSVRIRTTDSSGTTHDQALTIRVLPSVISTYSNFVSYFFDAAQAADPGISGDGVDLDGDGLNNRMEYVHGLDPFRPDASPFQVTTFTDDTGGEGRFIEFNFPWRADITDLNYTIVASTTLSSSWTNRAYQVISSTATDGIQNVLIRVDLNSSTETSEFFRLKVD